MAEFAITANPQLVTLERLAEFVMMKPSKVSGFYL